MAIDENVNLPSDLDELLADFADAVTQGIVAQLSEEIAGIQRTQEALSQRLEDAFREEIGTVISFSEEQAKLALAALEKIAQESEGSFNTLQNKVFAWGRENVENVQTVLGDTITKIGDGLRENIDTAIDLTDAIGRKITSAVTEAATQAKAQLDASTFAIREGIKSAVSEATEAVSGILEKVASVIAGLAETFEPLIEGLPKNIWASFTSSFSGVITPITSLFSFFSREHLEEVLEDFEPVFELVEDNPEARNLLDPQKRFQAIPLLGAAVPFILGLLLAIIVQVPAQAISGITEKIRLFSMRKFRPTTFGATEVRELINRGEIPDDVARVAMENTGLEDDDIARSIGLARSLLGVGELRELLRRGEISDEEAANRIKQFGFPEADAGLLSGLSRQLLGLGEILSLWRRKIIDEEEANARIGHLGFPDKDTEFLKILGFQLPPIQDIILFAVREVFDPEQAERLGQLEGLPSSVLQAYREKLGGFGEGIEGATTAVTEFARQAGLAPEWTAAYWASHWRQPGVQTLFDMVHRLAPDIVEARSEDFKASGLDPDGLKFTQDDLTRTLRAQDFSGFWREKLTALAFSPLTRVDVRRIHKLGLIDDAEVIRRYRELGFSTADAELMGKFTFAFNETPEETDDVETKKLTRAQILDFFESGAMTEEDAVTALVTIGYTSAVAETFVALTLIDQAKAQQEVAVRAILVRFNAGLIDFNGTVTGLDALNLPPIQRDLRIAQIEAEIAGRIREPSRAELDRFGREGIIDRGEYQEELQRIGYSELWANRFGVLTYEAERDLTRAQVLSFLEDSTFTPEEAVDKLDELGFSRENANRLVDQKLRELEEDNGEDN